MKVKFYLFVIALVLAHSQIRAQAGYNKMALGALGSSPSPANFSNGATLDDVDKSTGTLRVSIPLYEIKVNDISVPITLSYSATGIKVGQEAGVAGMGWELSAGGKITTNIQGRADYGNSGMGYLQPFSSSYNWSVTNSQDQQRLNRILDGKEDNAWDTYTYTLPHTSGSFVQNGLTFPYNPMVNVIDQSTQLFSNTITTSDGLVYRFATGDQRTSTKIINYDGSSPTFYQYISAMTDPSTKQTWNDYDLSSITSSRFKDVIRFKYHQFTDQADGARLLAKKRESYSESMFLYRQVYANSLNNGWYPSIGDPLYQTQSPVINKTVTTYNNHTRLDTIDYATGRVIFDYNIHDVLGRDELDTIRIYKKDNNTLSLIKKYAFVYDGGKQYGHYLVNLKIYDNKGIFQNAYQFDYFNHYLPVRPDTISKAVDEWGFYNGANNNATLLENPTKVLALKSFPHYPIQGNIQFKRAEQMAYYGAAAQSTGTDNYFTVPYAYRDFIFFAALSGTLTSVGTPSGALYKYEYDPHTFIYKDYSLTTYDPHNPSGGSWVNTQGGGIRVKSITAVRGHPNSYYGSFQSELFSKKIFTYGDSNTEYSLNDAHEHNNNGTANIPWMALCNTSIYTDSRFNPGSNAAEYYKAVPNIIQVSNPINNLSICNGSYVMYKSIIETDLKIPDNQSQTFGETIYYNHLPCWDPFETGGFNGQTQGGGLSMWSPYDNGQFPGPGTPAASLNGYYVPAPYIAGNLGFKAEDGAGVYAIIKARQDESGIFQPTETRKMTYNYFLSPQNKALYSLYAASAGQLSGEMPLTASIDDFHDVPIKSTNSSSDALLNRISYYFNQPQHEMDWSTRSRLISMGILQDFPGRYVARLINLNNFSYCKKLAEETIEDATDNSYRDITYTYDNNLHMMPTTITTTARAAGADKSIEHLTYGADYPMSADVSSFLAYNPMLADQPILDYTTHKTGNPGTNKLVGGTYSTFSLINGAIVPNKVYALTPSPNTSGLVPPNGANPWLGPYADSTLFKPVITYDHYQKGQIHQYTENGRKSSVILYSYHNQYPVAKIVNAGNYDDISQRSQDVAYTSFETKDTCNWVYAGNPVIDTSTISGKGVYPLSAGAITKVNNTLAGKYIISYWYKSGSTVTVSGATVGAAVIKTQLGAWILAEREVSNVGALTVSGTGFIDELRFFPKEAQMTTYIYDPEVGLTCTLDANSKPLYYEYDHQQRLSQIRDHNGNIIKAYKYFVGGSY